MGINKKLLGAVATTTALAGLGLAGSASAAAITAVGSIIDDAGNEVTQFRTAGTAKTLDIDGDNVYGTFGGIQYRVALIGNMGFVNSQRQVGPFGGYTVVDRIDGGADLQVRTTTNDGAAGSDQVMYTFSVNAPVAADRVMRVGVALDGLDGAQFTGASIGLREVGGPGSAEVATPANNNIDMYFFDVEGGVAAGTQFQVFGDSGASNFLTHQIVTLDVESNPLANGDVIKLDFSTAGDSDGGDLSDWNQISTGLNQTGIAAGDVKLDGGGTVDGVSVEITNYVAGNQNNDPASNNWSGTAADPYYIGAADDIYFHGSQDDFLVTFSGLDDSLLYNLRSYTLIGNNVGINYSYNVTDGAGVQSYSGSNASRWNAPTLEAGGTVFSGLRTDGAGKLVVTYEDPNFFAMNAIVLEAVPSPSAALAGLIGLGGLCARRRRR